MNCTKYYAYAWLGENFNANSFYYLFCMFFCESLDHGLFIAGITWIRAAGASLLSFFTIFGSNCRDKGLNVYLYARYTRLTVFISGIECVGEKKFFLLWKKAARGKRAAGGGGKRREERIKLEIVDVRKYLLGRVPPPSVPLAKGREERGAHQV